MIHLVIADVPTLNRLLWAASGRLMVVDDPAVLLGGWLPWVHRETGDTWLFRPWHVLPPAADLYYIDTSSIGVPDGERVLPLIAACDLLGIDEL